MRHVKESMYNQCMSQIIYYNYIQLMKNIVWWSFWCFKDWKKAKMLSNLNVFPIKPTAF